MAAAKDHMRTVRQMMCQLEKKPSSVELLWNDRCLDKLRTTVFEGNHLLRKPRKPKTLHR